MVRVICANVLAHIRWPMVLRSATYLERKGLGASSRWGEQRWWGCSFTQCGK